VTLAQLVPLLLQLSIAAIVVSLGLESQDGDLKSLVRRPGLFIRSVLAMNVLVPLAAAAIVLLFGLRPEVGAALILLSVAPVPPVLPGKQAKAGGTASYAVGLLVAAAVLAIFTVPLSIDLLGRVFGHELHVPAATIAKVVLSTVIAPLLLGAGLRKLLKGGARKLASILSRAAFLVLAIGFVVIVAKSWRGLIDQVGDGTLLAVLVFTIVSLVIGHSLGGPDPGDRSVLALASANRHPGVAMAIAGAIVTAEQKPALSAAVLFCFLVSTLLTGPYVAWRKKSGVTVPPPA
jgi:BASS family bile acid:Na+ symporter